MTSPAVPQHSTSTKVHVNARTMWSGGAATAVVAGLTALVGVLVCRWLFDIPLLAARSVGREAGPGDLAGPDSYGPGLSGPA